MGVGSHTLRRITNESRFGMKEFKVTMSQPNENMQMVTYLLQWSYVQAVLDYLFH